MPGHTPPKLFTCSPTAHEAGEVDGGIPEYFYNNGALPHYYDNEPLPSDICLVCYAEASVEDCSECGTCRQMVHAECCGLTFADDCQNCQAGRSYLYYPAGHSPSEIAGLQAAVTRNTTNEACPNTFLLTPGANFATNNPAYVAAAAAAGHFRPPGADAHVNANPGINGVDLAARLAELGRVAPTGPTSRQASSTEAGQAQESRQEQM